jgi:hypothetical protein
LALNPTKMDRWQYGRHIVETHRALASVDGPHAKLFEQIASNLDKELEKSPERGEG